MTTFVLNKQAKIVYDSCRIDVVGLLAKWWPSYRAIAPRMHLGILLKGRPYGMLHYEPNHLQKWYGYCRVCRIGSAAIGADSHKN